MASALLSWGKAAPGLHAQEMSGFKCMGTLINPGASDAETNGSGIGSAQSVDANALDPVKH